MGGGELICFTYVRLRFMYLYTNDLAENMRNNEEKPTFSRRTIFFHTIVLNIVVVLVVVVMIVMLIIVVITIHQLQLLNLHCCPINKIKAFYVHLCACLHFVFSNCFLSRLVSRSNNDRILALPTDRYLNAQIDTDEITHT